MLIGWIDQAMSNKTICMGFHLKWNITCSSDPDHLFKKVLQMSYDNDNDNEKNFIAKQH